MRSSLDLIKSGAEVVFGGGDPRDVVGADPNRGAFFPITLLACSTPLEKQRTARRRGVRPGQHRDAIRTVEAIELAKRGRGSLCGSLVTPTTAWRVTWCWVRRRIMAGCTS
ncbi:MAG: hypothetical protein U0163_20845 [Gemmatimonadaceae bacterium]